MQTIKPSSKQIFAKPSDKEERTKSGIFLTDSAKEQPRTAEIINIGSEVKGYQSGDVIVYRQYSTNDIKLNGEPYILIAEEDVLGTVVETA